MAKTRTKSKNGRKLDCGKVTHKLGPKCMLACRKAAKRADKLSDGTVLPLAAYMIASVCRNTKPQADQVDQYTHGLIVATERFGGDFRKRFSMNCYDVSKPRTKSTQNKQNNDLDRLIKCMELLGIIKRFNQWIRWANMVTPAERTTNDGKAVQAECDAVAALFGGDDAKPATRRKVKRCEDCEQPLAKCICEDEDEPDDEDDPTTDDDDDGEDEDQDDEE